MFYKCGPEEFYELPLWRICRQLKASAKWYHSSLVDLAGVVRMASQAKAQDFSSYIKALLPGKESKKILAGASAGGFGLGYKKNG